VLLSLSASCVERGTCMNDRSTTSTANGSVATNITIVASPRQERYFLDLNIQWQDSNPNG
jgi:hypothetical protein